MNYFQAIFLGAIQGLTEFLPISSSGHLVIFQNLFNLQPDLFFSVLVHVGTLGAVILFFKKKIIWLIGGFFRRDKEALSFSKLVIIGSLPIGVIGFLGEPLVRVVFGSLKIVFFSFLVTAGLLFLTKLKKEKGLRKLNTKNSFIIGLWQGLAVLPGISRSGATITAGLRQGIKMSEAFEFSFLLSLPAILGALALEITRLSHFSIEAFFGGFLGMIVSGVTGYLALGLLRKTLLAKKLWLFGVYCLLAALVIFFLELYPAC